MFLIPALGVFTVGIKGYLVEGSVIVNGESTTLDTYDLLIVIGLGIVFIILWLLLKDRIVRVKLGSQNITIYENGKESELVRG